MLDLSRVIRLGSRRISSKDILAMTTQLSTALSAGLPLLNCLELIGQQQNKPVMKEMFDGLTKSVSGGKSLSEALADYGSVCSPLYLSMIRVGETGGLLEQTTGQLANILSREEKIKTIIHELLHIPKNMGGGFRNHRPYVTRRHVNKVFKEYMKL